MRKVVAQSPFHGTGLWNNWTLEYSLHPLLPPVQAHPSSVHSRVIQMLSKEVKWDYRFRSHYLKAWTLDGCQGKGVEKSHQASVGSRRSYWSPESRQPGFRGASPRGTNLPQLNPLQAAVEATQKQRVEGEVLFTGCLCVRPLDKTIFYKYVCTCMNIFVCQPSFCSWENWKSERSGLQSELSDSRVHAFSTTSNASQNKFSSQNKNVLHIFFKNLLENFNGQFS